MFRFWEDAAKDSAKSFWQVFGQSGEQGIPLDSLMRIVLPPSHTLIQSLFRFWRAGKALWSPPLLGTLD